MVNVWPAGTECDAPGYQDFKKALNDASYHFADDSSKEWSRGNQCVRYAVQIAIENQYPYWAIERMIREINSLVTLSSFMSIMVNRLYAIEKSVSQETGASYVV